MAKGDAQGPGPVACGARTTSAWPTRPLGVKAEEVVEGLSIVALAHGLDGT